jgi:hypothetical protein
MMPTSAQDGGATRPYHVRREGTSAVDLAPIIKGVADWDWTATGTLALAVATVVLAWESRAGRRDERRQLEEGLLRAAIVEQLDCCARLKACPPADQYEDDRSAGQNSISFDSLRRLIEGVSLPDDLSPYLVGVIARVDQLRRRIMERELWGPVSVASWRWTRYGADVWLEWAVELGELQRILGLLLAEASRRGMTEGRAFVELEGLTPIAVHAGARATIVAELIALSPFPSGPACGHWSEPERTAASERAFGPRSAVSTPLAPVAHEYNR